MERLPNSYYSIPHLDLDYYEFQNEVNMVSKRFAKKHCVIPMELHGNVLVVCMGNPTKELYERLKNQTGHHITIFKGCPNKINKIINRVYGKRKQNQIMTNIVKPNVYH